MSVHANETRRLPIEADRRTTRRMRREARRASRYSGSIAGGVFLIGLGMLVLTGWWWPGIMLVIGVAGAAELMRQGRTSAALSAFVGCAAIPLAIAIVQAIAIPWMPVGAFVLIGMGFLALARTATQRVGGEQ